MDHPTPGVSDADRIRVFILDDHELVRRGLSDLLAAVPGIEIVGDADTASAARQRIPVLLPDVALLDARLGDGSGIDVCREIQATHPEVRCIILTSYDDDDVLFAAVMAGAAGFLLKEIGGRRLVDGIRQVAGGRSLMDPAVTSRILDRLRNPGAHPSYDAAPAIPSVEPSPVAPAAQRELITPGEASALLHVDTRTVGRWAASGKIASVLTPGGHRRFRRSDIQTLLTSDVEQVSPPLVERVIAHLDSDSAER